MEDTLADSARLVTEQKMEVQDDSNVDSSILPPVLDLLLLQTVSDAQKDILKNEEVVTSTDVGNLGNEAWENLKKKISTKTISVLEQYRVSTISQGSGGKDPKASKFPIINPSKYTITEILDYAANINWSEFKEENFPKFIASNSHPFKTEIDKCLIPCGISGRPNLLIYELRKIRNLPPGKLTQFLAKNKELNAIVGVSGCSKSRSILETLSTRMGMYFSAAHTGEGSHDLPKLMKQLNADIYNQPQDQVEYLGHLTGLAILYSRFEILRVVTNNFTTKLDPLDWLYLQLFPSPQLDIFKELAQIVRSQIDYSIMRHKISEFCKAFTVLYGDQILIVVDEAQELMYTLTDKFLPSRTKSGDPPSRPFFTSLIKSWRCDSEMVICVSGTGLNLEEIVELSSSLVLKPAADFRKDCVWNEFGGYFSHQTVMDYLSKFFGQIDTLLNSDDTDLIRGRFRFAANFVQNVLQSNEPSKTEILKNTIMKMKKDIESSSCEREPTSIRFSLRELLKGNRKAHLSSGMGTLEIIKNLTVSYYLFGKAVLFQNPSILELVEVGICPLKTKDGELHASISEPMTAYSCFCFFKDLGQGIEGIILELLGVTAISISPSTCGIIIESYLIPKIISYLVSNGNYIDDHSYFSNIKQFLPEWFKNMKWNTQLKVSHHKSDYCLINWLNEKDPQNIFVPEKEAKFDAVVRLNATKILGKNEERICTMQFKLYGKDLTAPEMKNAVDSTKYDAPYTRKNAANPSQKSQTSIGIMKSKFQANQGIMRIVFYYPGTSTAVKKSYPSVIGNDVVVFLNQESAVHLFSKDDTTTDQVWNFLENLKKK